MEPMLPGRGGGRLLPHGGPLLIGNGSASPFGSLPQLQSAEARAMHLEREIVRERRQNLRSLSAAYGFSSLRDFINAMRAALGLCNGKECSVL
jgi:hypothetical protein